MKIYNYQMLGAKTEITFANGEKMELGKVTEFEIDFNLKDNYADFSKEPLVLNNATIGFTVLSKMDKDFYDDWFNTHHSYDAWFQQKYFKIIEVILYDKFINNEMKRTFFEWQSKGFLFNPTFRQEIYPRLAVRIKFITSFKVERVGH